MSEPKEYYYAVASSSGMTTWLWQLMKGVHTLEDARKEFPAAQRADMAASMILSEKIKSNVFVSNLDNLAGVYPPGERGAKKVDAFPPPDGKPRYYGVGYWPDSGDPLKHEWMWTIPMKNKEMALIVMKAGAERFMGALASGMKLRICQTTRTDMQGWQPAGRPEDGVWIDE